MKRAIIIVVLLAASQLLWGGESCLTRTYQPLDGLGSGGIVISQVTCHDWYSHSGQPTAIGLISAPNVPPTNNPKEATRDLNLASVCGVRFGCGDVAAARELTLNATGFAVPKGSEHSNEHVVRACLECLRLCLPKEFRDTPVTLKASEPEKSWMSEIVREFNAHDRTNVFFNPPA